MRIAGELTTRLKDEGGEAKEPASEVLIDGRPTGKLVPGAVLEAAVHCANRYLLFMTDDFPFEEMLRVVLLDDQFRPVDSALIGGPYSTGSFSSLQLSEPNRVGFRFIGDVPWEIELLSEPGFRIPFVSEPTGVWRSPGFSRHFIVRGKPLPQTN
jgi:hypothetical protein